MHSVCVSSQLLVSGAVPTYKYKGKLVILQLIGIIVMKQG